MGEDRKINSFESFLKDVLNVDKTKLDPSDKSKKFAVLFGNGLLTSNNQIRTNLHIDYSRILSEVYLEFFLKHSGLMSKINSPEKFLYIMKYLFVEKILEQYSENDIQHSQFFKTENFREHLRQYSSIFTLNYDPIIYRALLENHSNGAQIIVDGFKGKELISIDDIASNLLTKDDVTPFFYIHGAFHIIYNQSVKKYYKLVREQEGTLMDSFLVKLNEIFNRFKNHEERSDNLSLVIAVKDHYKKADIEIDPYLKFCLDELKKKKKLFIFGCSFEFDSHILEALAEGEVPELYISYLESDKVAERGAKYNIKKHPIYPKLKDKITWVETSDFADVIWEKPKTE